MKKTYSLTLLDEKVTVYIDFYVTSMPSDNRRNDIGTYDIEPSRTRH